MSATIVLPDTFAHFSDELLRQELASLRRSPGDRDRMAYALWAARLAELAEARGLA